MNQLMTVRQEKILSWTITALFLLIHIFLLVMFSICRVKPMAWFNVFSIAFYIWMFYAIHREWFRFFVDAIYIEVLLHMTLAALFTGWENGFQITLIGMSVLAFFAEFLGRSLKMPFVRAVPLCVVGALSYLGCFVACIYIKPSYILPENLSKWLQIGWGIVTFSINIAALSAFTMISFHADQLLSRQAGTDNLTGLPNRYYVNHAGHEYMHKGGWLAMMDIDDFKQVNDTYGHNFGDEVLVTIADLMRKNASGAAICRWGGEEFLLMGNAETALDAQVLLDNVRHVIEQHRFCFGENQVRLTVTLGLAPYDGETDLTDWINLADKKLYLGKRSGKNQVVQ